MSDEERAQATAERKLVRDNNKAWANAVTVRRRWLADNFLQRKTAPPPAPSCSSCRRWSAGPIGCRKRFSATTKYSPSCWG